MLITTLVKDSRHVEVFLEKKKEKKRKEKFILLRMYTAER